MMQPTTTHDFTAVPLSMSVVNLYDLEVVINGVTARFHLDSGAGMTCLDRGQLELFGLKEDESDSYNVNGIGGGQKIHSIEVETFEINGVALDTFKLHTIDMSHVLNAVEARGGEKVQGVLGADVLKRYSAIIDYGQHTLFLKN